MAIGDVDAGSSTPGTVTSAPPVPAASSAPSPGSGSPSSDATASTPIALADDTLIRVPGSDEPVRWQDYQARQTQAQQDFERRKAEATRLLQTRAQQLDEQARRFQTSAGTTPTTPTPTDPLSALRGKPVVDGNTVAALVEQVQQGNIQPLYQWANAMNQLMAETRSQQQSIAQRLEPFEHSQDEAVRTSTITAALESAGADPSRPELADGSTALTEFATNVYYGWHPNRSDFQTDQEYATAKAEFDQQYPSFVATQLEGLRKAVRLIDRMEAEEARRRLIPSRGGAATPTGDRPYQFETARDLARRAAAMGVFDSTTAAT